MSQPSSKARDNGKHWIPPHDQPYACMHGFDQIQFTISNLLAYRRSHFLSSLRSGT